MSEENGTTPEDPGEARQEALMHAMPTSMTVRLKFDRTGASRADELEATRFLYEARGWADGKEPPRFEVGITDEVPTAGDVLAGVVRRALKFDVEKMISDKLPAEGEEWPSVDPDFDAFYAVLGQMTAKQQRLFACDCASRALLFRSRNNAIICSVFPNAVLRSRAFAEGETTPEELDAAFVAAIDATDGEITDSGAIIHTPLHSHGNGVKLSAAFAAAPDALHAARGASDAARKAARYRSGFSASAGVLQRVAMLRHYERIGRDIPENLPSQGELLENSDKLFASGFRAHQDEFALQMAYAEGIVAGTANRVDFLAPT